MKLPVHLQDNRVDVIVEVLIGFNGDGVLFSENMLLVLPFFVAYTAYVTERVLGVWNRCLDLLTLNFPPQQSLLLVLKVLLSYLFFFLCVEEICPQV